MSPDSLQRLKSLHADNEATGAVMDEKRGRFAALAGREETKAISSFNLFQTPRSVARQMAWKLAAGLSGIEFPHILEPSTGLGRLYREAVEVLPESRFYLVEQSRECFNALQDNGLRELDLLWCKDFEAADPYEMPRKMDGVIMNPPFKMGTDIRHIKHALNFLKDGGLLVALCYNGKRQNEKLKPLCDTWEVLPDGSFKEEGTGASVALLTIQK